MVQPRSATSELLKFVGLDKTGDVLEASAAQAEEVARYLKQNMKLDTYVLHTRTGSIVTVGGYDSLDDENMRMMVKRLSPKSGGGGLEFQGTGIKLFDRPLPMKVPQL